MNEVLPTEVSPELQPSFSEAEKEAIERLIVSLKRIEEHVPKGNHADALSFLLERSELNGLQGIVTKAGIKKTDTVSEIITKLENALSLEVAERSEIQSVPLREVANDNTNVEHQSERDQIQQELVLLELFAQTQEDILHTESRIAEYEKELEALIPEGQSGFWKSFFSKEESADIPSDSNQEKREELENKIMRAETELAGRIQKAEADAVHFQELLRTWQERLGEPVEEADDWQQLVEEIRKAGKKLLAVKDSSAEMEKNSGQKENLVL